MKHSHILSCFALLFLILFLNGPQAEGQRTSPAAALSAQSYEDRPLSFEPNRGQTADRVAFLAHGSDYTLFLTSEEAVFAYLPEPIPTSRENPQTFRPKGKSRPTRPAVLRMQLVGANPDSVPTPAGPLSGRSNYLTGSDPARWWRNIPTYAKVQYPEVYRGIDLIYYGNQRRLEYDFVVRPHADPSAIGVKFAGAKRVRIDKQGALHLGLPRGEMVWHRPVVYQERNGERQEIVGGYRLCREGAPGSGRTPLVRFEVGGITVTLTSGDPLITVPTTVTVAADAITATFVANTRSVTAPTLVAVTATSAVDTIGKPRTLTLNPPNISSVTLSPTSVKGGRISTGTVTIDETAPVGDIVVNLSSNKLVATPPASVTIPSGVKSAIFTINTTPVTADTIVTVSGAFNSQTKTAVLTYSVEDGVRSFRLGAQIAVIGVPLIQADNVEAALREYVQRCKEG